MNLIWDLTNRCNLNCKHCSNVYLMKNNTTMEKQSWKKVLDYTNDFVDSVTLLGGEPLLHPEINSILKTLTEKNISINIITNGQFDSSTWDEIMKYNISSIQVSIEGMKNSHDIIRGAGTFDKAVKSIKYLREINSKINNRTNIGVSMVINNLTQNNIIEFIDSTKHWNIFYSLSSLYLEGNAKDNKDLLNLQEDKLLEFYEKIALYNSKNLDIEIKLDLLPIVADYLNRKYGTNYSIREINCKGLTDQVYADPYGVIQPCRKYNKIQVDTNQPNSNWKDDYHLFKPFLEKIHTVENNHCNICIYKSSCTICPFENTTTMPSVCKEIFKRIPNLSVPLESKFKIKKPYLIIKLQDSYKIFFPNNHLIVDYEQIGGEILEYLDDFKTIEDISNKFSLNSKTVYEFLLQEKYSNKVIEKREFS